MIPRQLANAHCLFFPTIEVINGLRASGWRPISAKQENFRVGSGERFQRHLVRFQRFDQQLSTEGLRPELVLANSDDTSSAFQLHLGFYRTICRNCLLTDDSSFTHMSIGHSSFDLWQVVGAAARIANGAPQIIERIRGFRYTQLSNQQRLDFAKAALILRYSSAENAPIGPDRLLTLLRAADSGNDLWTTFNVVQESLIQEDLRDHPKCKISDRRAPKN